MWTFLGIASFTYLYKKFDSVLTLAPKELVMAAALFLIVGLLLSYFSYFHDQKLSLSQVAHLPRSLLSLIPVIKHLIPRTSAQSSGRAESGWRKVRQFMWTKEDDYPFDLNEVFQYILIVIMSA